jgi:YbbR domain-containing protein
MKRFDQSAAATVWRRIRRTVADPEQIGRLVTRNAGLKLLSLFIAFGLWFFVNFGERDTEESLRVPLELRNIPAHLAITSPRMDFVDLRLSGPRALLGRIDRGRLSVGLDLSGVRAGPAVFRVDVESINLPRGVKTLRINPSQVTLELERVGRKTVPVHLRVGGTLPPDLEVVGTEVAPETVEVSGPASDIAEVAAANTEPLDLAHALPGTLERELWLEPAGEYLAFSANRVAVQVRIAETLVTREVKGVAVEVRNATDLVQVKPDRIRVTLRGPKSVVGEPTLTLGLAYVDAAGLAAGTHSLLPHLDVPEGVEVVAVDPPRVNLVLSVRKGGGRGRR